MQQWLPFFSSLSLQCAYVQLFTISSLLFSVLLPTYSSSHVFALISIMNHLLPNFLMYLSFPCWPTSALLQISHYPRKSSTDLVFSKHCSFSSYSVAVPFACFNTRSYGPCITSLTPKYDNVRVSLFFKNLLLLLRDFFFSSLFLLSPEIHTFKTPSCTLSIARLICCNISLSALSKCNLVPLIPTQNATTKMILLICRLDHVNTAPAVLHQASY